MGTNEEQPWKGPLKLFLTLIGIAAWILVSAMVGLVLIVWMLQESSRRHENGGSSTAIVTRDVMSA